MAGREGGQRGMAEYYDSNREFGPEVGNVNSIETPGIGGGAGMAKAKERPANLAESAARFRVGGSADAVFELRTPEAQANAAEEEQRLQIAIRDFEQKEQELAKSYRPEWKRIDPNQRFRGGQRGEPIPFDELTPYERFQNGFAIQKKKFFGGFEYIDNPAPTDEDRRAFEQYNQQMEEYGRERRMARSKLSSLVEARDYERTIEDFDRRSSSRAQTAAEFQQLIGGELRFGPEDVIVVPGDGSSSVSEQNSEKVLTYFIPQEGKYSPQSAGVGGVRGPAGQFRGPQKLILERNNADGSKEQFLYVHDATLGKWRSQDYGSRIMPVPRLKARVKIRDGVVVEKEVH